MDQAIGTPSNDSGNEAFEVVLARRLSRRAVLKGGLAGLTLAISGQPLRVPPAAAAAGFAPVVHSKEDRILLPPGYTYDVVIRWGDPLFADAPDFDPAAQSSERQARQLGYNCDFLGYLPLPLGSGTAGHGLLVINQEYTNPELMFPSWDGKPDSKTKEMVDIELAAHGVSIVEVRRGAGGRWAYLRDSPLNRRLTAETPMRLSGPAAGHPWMRTSYDAAGTLVRGTLNNCAGGVTPWGTVLSAEENFPFYFGGPRTPAGIPPSPPITNVTGSATGTSGRAVTVDSIWARNRTSRCASAGWSRSTRTIPGGFR